MMPGMRVLYLDCFSGISGDMTVGALCDLGVPPSAFEWELGKVDLGDFHLHFARASRQGIAGVKFGVHSGAVHTHDQDEPEETHGHDHVEGDHEHGQEHEHGHHHHHHHHHGGGEDAGRSYAEIRALIEGSDLSDFVKRHALSIFRRIGEAEARIHGVPVETVGFHEVGALDSIADILCACVGIEALGVEKICLSPLVDGQGWIDCAHGRFPVPAPATLEILRGIELTQIDEPGEMITPTGAAIAAEFAAGFGPMPRMRVDKIGYGLGARDNTRRANVLRAVLGEVAPAAATDTVTQIETDIDDQSPEITGALIDRLLAAGALDANLTPTLMKKNRPGVRLTVLCEPAAAPALADLIFTETTSFGVRLSQLERLKLDRRAETVTTPYGEVSVKLGYRAGELLQVAPEFESCRAAAGQSCQPLREVFRAAEQAYRTRAT